MRTRLLTCALLLPALAGCATKRDLRDLRAEVTALQAAQTAMQQELQRQHAALQDSLSRLALQNTQHKGELSTQLVQLERQLITLQELTGQSQQGLSTLRQEPESPPPTPPPGARRCWNWPACCATRRRSCSPAPAIRYCSRSPRWWAGWRSASRRP